MVADETGAGEVNWLTLSEIRPALFRHSNGGSQLKHKLETLAGHRLLNIRVRSAIITGSKETRETDWIVDQAFLDAAHDKPSRANISVSSDELQSSLTGGSGYSRRIRLSCAGLSFSQADIEAAFPGVSGQVEPQASVSQEPNRSGRPPSKKDWQHFCAALAVVAGKTEDGVGSDVSAASIYEKAALVLQARLGSEATYLKLDSVMDAITLAQEWTSKGMPEE